MRHAEKNCSTTIVIRQLRFTSDAEDIEDRVPLGVTRRIDAALLIMAVIVVGSLSVVFLGLGGVLFAETALAIHAAGDILDGFMSRTSNKLD